VKYDVSDGKLTISGSGMMQNYTEENPAPWIGQTATFTEVVVEEGVTTVGDRAFANCPALAEVTFPEEIAIIGAETFSGCTSLTGAYFYGDAPTVVSALEDNSSFDPATVTLYYVEGASGWTDSPAYDAETGTWNGYKLECWGAHFAEENDLFESAVMTVRKDLCAVKAELTDLTETVSVFFAAYDEDGRIVDVELREIAVSAMSRRVTFDVDATEADSVKLMVASTTSHAPCDEAAEAPVL